MNLDDRMKRYEAVFNQKLAIKTPVIIFIDGKAFHAFTRGFDKPFDDILIEVMRKTMMELCDKIQGAKLAYTQSDEIGILLTDWENFETSPWFDYRVQKVCSISAAIATAAFNRFYHEQAQERLNVLTEHEIFSGDDFERACKDLRKDALFDARCFNLPMHEVPNWFLWRQQDWERNSMQMLARSVFSAKELHKKNRVAMKSMLATKGLNWDDLEPIHLRHGSTAVKYDNAWGLHGDIKFKGNIELFEEALGPTP